MQSNGNPQALLQQLMSNATPEQMLFTLKHELAHVWLYENGHIYQDEEKRFTYEDMCEYIALSNNSINNVVDLYLKSILLLGI